ncbi:phage major capsid protein [Lysinibacillus sp.]|uniref:phage major capsid protein n=1 Tax=Lysinibacillus sp. TaxID=1869345 RepID=UPI0028AC42FE|nr:phage major capsid protein [Lysinibacillus sp.]
MTTEEKEKRLTENADLEAPTKAQSDEADSENAQDDDTKSKDAAQDEKVISGYAIKFGKPSKDLGGFVEVITPDALKEVDLSNVILLHGHDYSKPLASVKAGTLKLEVDEIGLRFEAILQDTTYANDIYKNIQAGIIDSMSFGFEMGIDSFDKDEDGIVTRSIEKMKALHEISIVTIPAYDESNVQVNTRSYEAWVNQNTNKKDDEEMVKTLLNNENTETRSFETYIRSHGEVRDGLTTVNADVVIPKDIIGEVFDLKRQRYNLAQYATVKEVSNGQGKYPIATNQEATLATKEELALIADVEADMFTQVQYNVQTRAGKIALSNEVVEDAAVDIVGEVKAQLQKLIENTDNANIIAKLKAFTKVEATGLDDLKKVNNVTLDPALNKMVIVNQDTFNYLDTLKDADDRYLLQPDVTAASGYSLFGNPVVVISNKLLPSPAVGTYPMIMGDIAQAIFVARRNQVTTQWEQFDYYSQGLAVIVRNDYQVIDADAARYIEITPA